MEELLERLIEQFLKKILGNFLKNFIEISMEFEEKFRKKLPKCLEFYQNLKMFVLSEGSVTIKVFQLDESQYLSLLSKNGSALISDSWNRHEP